MMDQTLEADGAGPSGTDPLSLAVLSGPTARKARPAPRARAAGDLKQGGTGDAREARFLTVTELAKELGVTARAIRFYEDKGLITPNRVASTRIYSNRERARMILILRGKRLGFSLREIKDYLDLYDADPKRVTQTRVLLEKIAKRTKQLEDQRVALDQALKGLRELEIDARAVLAKAERQAAEPRPSNPPKGSRTSAPPAADPSGPPRHKARSSASPRAAASAAPATNDHQEPSA